MPAGLTYLSAKCVLEHMEGNKRIYLASRCPLLRGAERSTPLHLDLLKFEDSAIKINKLKYRLEPISKEFVGNRFGDQSEDTLLPGDILLDTPEVIERNGVHRTRRPSIQDYSGYVGAVNFGETHRTTIKNPLKLHLAMKKLACHLLEGRMTVIVKKLGIRLIYEKILRVPDGFKVSVLKKLDTGVNDIFRIKTRENGSMVGTEPEGFTICRNISEHRMEWGSRRQIMVMKNAQILKIVILGSVVAQARELSTVFMNEIHFVVSNMTKHDLLTIVRSWVQEENEIGYCYTFDCQTVEDVVVMLQFIKEELNLVPRKFLTEFGPLDRTHCLAVPINQEREIIIYAYQDPSKAITKPEKSLRLRMEIVPHGSSSPVPRDLSYFLQTLYTRKFGLIGFFSCVVIALGVLALACFFVI